MLTACLEVFARDLAKHRETKRERAAAKDRNAGDEESDEEDSYEAPVFSLKASR